MRTEDEIFSSLMEARGWFSHRLIDRGEVKQIQSDAEQSGYQRGFNEGRKCGMMDAMHIIKSLTCLDGAPFIGPILEAMNKLP